MNRSRYYPSVDGLKGLLIFLIVLHNLLPSVPAAGTSGRIIDAIPLTSFISIYGGSLGDCLFFMISGFLISTGYKSRLQEHRIAFKDYLWKRLCKLYPMYIISNFAMLILHILEYGPSGINIKRIVFTVLIQFGGGLTEHPYNGPSWFLSALFLCYILYFAACYFSSRPTQYYLLLSSGILLGYALLMDDWQFSLLTAANGMGILNFSIGCVIADLYPQIREKRPNWLPTACFLILGASGYLMLRYGVEIIAGDSKVAFTFLVSPAVLYLALDSKLFRWLLETRPVQLLGRISMCVFFWHFPIFIAMQYLFRQIGLEFTELYFPLYLALLVLFSILHHCITRKKKTVSSV